MSYRQMCCVELLREELVLLRVTSHVLFSPSPSCCLNEGWGSSTNTGPRNNLEGRSQKRRDEGASVLDEEKPLHNLNYYFCTTLWEREKICASVKPVVLIFFLLAAPHGLQDLSSPTRDQSQAPAVKALSPNHWTAREFPVLIFYNGLSKLPVKN